jgi:hypothetical protein
MTKVSALVLSIGLLTFMALSIPVHPACHVANAIVSLVTVLVRVVAGLEAL